MIHRQQQHQASDADITSTTSYVARHLPDFHCVKVDLDYLALSRHLEQNPQILRTIASLHADDTREDGQYIVEVHNLASEDSIVRSIGDCQLTAKVACSPYMPQGIRFVCRVCVLEPDHRNGCLQADVIGALEVSSWSLALTEDEDGRAESRVRRKPTEYAVVKNPTALDFT